MLGGYQIIDLRSTGLVLSSEKQTITDVKILDQLRSFRDYIEKSHDYAKPLNKALKPVLIRYRDGKTDEELEVSAFALIKNSNASLTYEIITNKLMIEVVFEEKTDDDGNKYYDIKTAKYLYNNDVIVEGDLTVTGDAKLFENIVDAQGHKRFIEGNVEKGEDISADITLTYGKYSLSGTHLMIVCLLHNQSENDITIGSYKKIFTCALPEWIYNKIYALAGSATVASKKISTFNQSTVVIEKNTYTFYINKVSPLIIGSSPNNFVLESGDFVRIQFDLLIENEVTE